MRDRQLWLCAALTLAIVLPRSLLITRAHNESVDDEYHLDHGLCVIRRVPHPLTYNDPPFGEAILALPLHLLGVQVQKLELADSNGTVSNLRTVLYGQRLSPESLRLILAAWKAVLFLPGVLVAFLWARQIFGLRSAWLACALFLVEPTIAAHIPVAALDVMAMEAVIIASYLVWRYFQQPGTARLIAAGIATAAAMLTKHTAIVLPGAIIVLASLHWFARLWWQGVGISTLNAQLRPRLNALAGGAIIVLLAIWPLSLFDFSAPTQAGRVFGIEYDGGIVDRVLLPVLSVRWPAGIYIGSVFEAVQHGKEGHSCFLWGEIREHGWWYYFFAVSLYKIPVGIWLILLLALLSVIWFRPRWDELFLVVPLVTCGVLICAGGINVGFRHALPSYGLLLLLASRCVADGSRATLAAAWLGIVVAAGHAFSFHPDYIAYLNAPWRRPWLAIADSNLDWGQSLKQVEDWLEANPEPGRIVHLDGFDEPPDPALSHYVKHQLHIVPKNGPAPTSGLLIVSPSWLAGVYNRDKAYPHLRDVDPIDLIGHSMLVYDLDGLKKDP